jgi:hypothetical protein
MTHATEWNTKLELAGVDHPDYERLVNWFLATSLPSDSDDLQELADTEQEHFLGEYESPADFALESLGNAYMDELEALPTAVQNAIDWSQVWDRYLRHDCDYLELPNYSYLIWHTH